MTDNNYILARSKEHKLILETLGEVESTIRLSERSELIANLKKIMENFQQYMLKHQELEEKVIFQAGLEAAPSEKVARLTIELVRDHGTFNTIISSVLYRIWSSEPDEKLIQRITLEMNQLTSLIKRHSLLEVKELFPLLSNNLRCRQLIERYSQNFPED